jgi:hypothetical protein
MLSNGFECLGARSFPFFGRVGVLTSLPVIEEAQESIKSVDQKTAPLQTTQGCGTQDSKSREDWPSLTHRIISHFKGRRTRRVVVYIRAREPEVPPLPGLSCHYWVCFPRLPLHFVQGKRNGLRCGVPPGLPATWNWSTTDRRYLPCSSATNLVNSLPGVSFLAVVSASDVSIAFVIAWGRKGRRINCPA